MQVSDQFQAAVAYFITTMTSHLVNEVASNAIYSDDIRIQRFNANMQTFAGLPPYSILNITLHPTPI
jgi:hypothetical protein